MILVFGYNVYDRWGLLVAFFVVVLWNFYIYFYNDQKLHRVFSSQQAEGSDPWGIYQTVHYLASRAQIPAPRIFIVSLETPTAFSIGIFYKSIMISRKLVEVLTQEELKSVLAHEVFHIKQDTLSFGVGSAVMSFCFFWGDIVDRAIVFILKRVGWKVYQRDFLVYLFMPVALFCFRWIVDSKSDYKADQFAASISDNPEYLARALWKLESYHQASPFGAPLAMAHFFIVNPLKSKAFTQYLMPSVESRIRRLINRYPL